MIFRRESNDLWILILAVLNIIFFYILKPRNSFFQIASHSYVFSTERKVDGSRDPKSEVGNFSASTKESL